VWGKLRRMEGITISERSVVRKGEYDNYDGRRKEPFINIVQQLKEQLGGYLYTQNCRK
jgi:hypothetical protein